MSLGGGQILDAKSVVLAGQARNQDAAIDEAGALLVAAGAVDADYVASMHDRERSIATYMGEGLAIPHGTNEAKQYIHSTALSFIRYPESIDWAGKPVEFVVGIAGLNDEHLELLAMIATVFTDPEAVQRLRSATTPEEVLAELRHVEPRMSEASGAQI